MFSDPVMDENGNVIKWNTRSDYWNSPPMGRIQMVVSIKLIL